MAAPSGKDPGGAIIAVPSASASSRGWDSSRTIAVTCSPAPFQGAQMINATAAAIRSKTRIIKGIKSFLFIISIKNNFLLIKIH